MSEIVCVCVTCTGTGTTQHVSDAARHHARAVKARQHVGVSVCDVLTCEEIGCAVCPVCTGTGTTPTQADITGGPVSWQQLHTGRD